MSVFNLLLWTGFKIYNRTTEERSNCLVKFTFSIMSIVLVGFRKY